ncbi:aminotransferase class I/II-fold pyridoxal phosphate-dependent enzyme [Eisenibacter elegans]|uniref:aminotransferase class I/II-fold pyridoxal phosphate-dependent enzyme n=1 Tax=Eisenibacter elegans TaxID=997 RepID=UPI0003FAF241|nr:aminotransferase class I/II-fold pyridoxal phosphate-dependent enzyme [Eisenibacter elegans]
MLDWYFDTFWPKLPTTADLPQDPQLDFGRLGLHQSPPEGLQKYLANRWESLTHYPQTLSEAVKQALAKHHGLPAERFLPLNGLSEGIYLLAQAHAGAKSSVLSPYQGLLHQALTMYGHQLTIQAQWQQLSATDLVWIANPNPVTGSLLYLDELEELLLQYCNTLFVVDESFIACTPNVGTCVRLVGRYPNLTVLRSFTVAYAVPGLRVGYVVGSAQLIRSVAAYQIPFSVNAMALETMRYFLSHKEQVEFDVEAAYGRALALTKMLRQLPAMEVQHHHTHYLIARVLHKPETEVSKYLTRQGMALRNLSEVRGLTQGFFGVVARGEAANLQLYQALEGYLAQNPPPQKK